MGYRGDDGRIATYPVRILSGTHTQFHFASGTYQVCYVGRRGGWDSMDGYVATTIIPNEVVRGSGHHMGVEGMRYQCECIDQPDIRDELVVGLNQ